MAKRMQKLLAALAAFAALATGGAVFAQAQSQPASGSETPSAVDRDNIQSGDQTTPDQPAAAAARHASSKARHASAARHVSTVTSTAAQQQEPAGSAEQPGTETADEPGSESSEQAGTESETAPGSDGPGGHADEPGNPNADHQFQGAE